jgi:hypothetical protein
MKNRKFEPNTKRNYKNVTFSKQRQRIDLEFNVAHDELSDCYYNYWRQGDSKPFTWEGKTFDVQETQQESKALFDKIHGEIHEKHRLKLIDELEKDKSKLSKREKARLENLKRQK